MIIYYKSFYIFHENLVIKTDSNTKLLKNIKKLEKILKISIKKIY